MEIAEGRFFAEDPVLLEPDVFLCELLSLLFLFINFGRFLS